MNVPTGLAKKCVFHNILWKNPNDLFGQPNKNNIESKSKLQNEAHNTILFVSLKLKIPKSLYIHEINIYSKHKTMGINGTKQFQEIVCLWEGRKEGKWGQKENKGI